MLTGFFTPLASSQMIPIVHNLRECVISSEADCARPFYHNSDVSSLVLARAHVYIHEVRIGRSGGVCSHVISVALKKGLAVYMCVLYGCRGGVCDHVMDMAVR